MKLFKRLIWNSEYSWLNWMKLGLLLGVLYVVTSFFSPFIGLILDGNIFGVIILVIIFGVLLGPLMLGILGVSAAVGLVVGGTSSGIKQHKSYKETVATGSPELLALEKLRIRAQLLQFLWVLCAIGLVGLWFVVAVPLWDAFGEASIYGYGICALIVLGIVWAMIAPVKRRYQETFKEAIVRTGLESVLQNLDFRPNETLDHAVVQSTELFSDYDHYSGNDYLEADYRGRHFIQSDIHLQKEKEETYFDQEGNLQTRTVYVTVFQGRLMIFDYDAISNEPVAVYDRGGKKPGSKVAIQTELDAFNQLFYISADDANAALRILTPQVLEGIVLTRNKIDCPLYLSFRNDKLYIAMMNGDSFEAAGGDVTLSEQRNRVTHDIEAMLALVETLYLK